ncbi:hypothetical protein CS0771_26070 [Catellatospora sp. IY07-71]|uniref:DUF4231 domain-containing protein n=1 Tax=Catellatospora sp. IY07-71 TaxID=2728827 RepID=UPI001BB45DB9|nr:DUF4231 domain-containing protein [Catellatospora sp. IY07-71]BCJ73063.1 hypothetical protein CS0771_26070 [Catellatospora sp. IY07-71]
MAEQPVWWQRLTSPGGAPLPLSVHERLGWYERQVRRQRIANYTLEGVTVVVAASIPAAVALGAPAAVTAVLGALVAVLAGLRQLVRPGESWIRFSATLVALQRETVMWSAGAAPYDADRAETILVENVESLVASETSQWAEQRTVRRAEPEQQPVS